MNTITACKILKHTLGLLKLSGFTLTNKANGAPVISTDVLVNKNAMHTYPDKARTKAQLVLAEITRTLRVRKKT